MKNKLMLTASAIAFLSAAPAFANNNEDKPDIGTVTQSEIEATWESTKENTKEAWSATKEGANNAWNETKQTTSDAAEAVSDATVEAYNETRALLDTNTDIDTYVENDMRVTADTVIGQDVFNQKGDVVASVSDFVIDENGQVRGLIVSYGGMFGIGSKDIMLDFETIEARADNAGYTTQLSKVNMDNYPAFNADNLSNPMHLASDLMGSNIVNPEMSSLAEVENFVIENGQATKLIVSYMDGIMPEMAMIDFTDADIVMNEDREAQFKLSMNETKRFETFKNQ